MSVRVADLIPPLVFGLVVLALWEAVVRLFGVPAIILPPPSAIVARLVSSVPTLSADFLQTIKGVLVGYAIGCAAGLIVAILVDRSSSCSAACCRSAISSRRCRLSASRRSW